MSGLVIWIKKKLELLLKYYRPLYAWGYDFLPKCSSSHLWLPLPKLWRSKFCKQSRSTGTHVWSRAVFDLRVENAVDRPKESLEAYSPYPPPPHPQLFRDSTSCLSGHAARRLHLLSPQAKIYSDTLVGPPRNEHCHVFIENNKLQVLGLLPDCFHVETIEPVQWTVYRFNLRQKINAFSVCYRTLGTGVFSLII